MSWSESGVLKDVARNEVFNGHGQNRGFLGPWSNREFSEAVARIEDSVTVVKTSDF